MTRIFLDSPAFVFPHSSRDLPIPNPVLPSEELSEQQIKPRAGSAVSSVSEPSRGRFPVSFALGLVVAIIIAAIAGVYLYKPAPASPSDCVSPTLYTVEPCVSVFAELKSNAVVFQVMNQGAFQVTLDQATIFGAPSNSGFTGNVTIGLNGTTLGINGHQTYTSPPLPSLRAGDKVFVRVSTTSDTYYMQNLTA